MSKIDLLSDMLSITKTGNTKSFHFAVCPEAKQKRLSFIFYNKISKESFDLVHIDVWGQFSVMTHEGYRFFYHF